MLVPIKRTGRLEATDTAGSDAVELDDAPIKDAGRKAGTVAGVISAGLITAFIQLATFLFIDRPKASTAREMELDKSNVEALERALAVEDDPGRRMSVRLLLATGVLDPEDREQINTLLDGKEPIPRWVKGNTSRPSGAPDTETPQQSRGSSNTGAPSP